jgi:hypothetical protein
MGMSVAEKNAQLNAQFQGTDHANVYLAQFFNGVELATSGYARKQVVCDDINFPDAVGGVISNGVRIDFDVLAAEAEIDEIRIYDASVAGTELFRQPITSAEGTEFYILPGSLTITLT